MSSFDPIIPSTLTTEKMAHGELILHGVCTHCAHCALKLTDSVSISRGIGPVCSKHGYNEEPVDGCDDLDALIHLSEYPQVVKFLMDHYKPLGNRGLLNGLVRLASLNRKSKLHVDICDAIEALGYKRLSSTLRKSISVIEIKEAKDDPNFFAVWVKRSEFSWNWVNDLKKIPGQYYNRAEGVSMIPKTQKKRLWRAMLTYYEGLCADTPSGCIRIRKKSIEKEVPPSVPEVATAV